MPAAAPPADDGALVRFASTVVYVHDVVDALRFYADAFGVAPAFVDTDVQMAGRSAVERYEFAELRFSGGVVQFATPALGALLMPGFPTDRATEGLEIAFYTNDVRAAFGAAVAAGAAPLRAPEAMPWGQTVSYVRAPHGVYVAICTPPIEPASAT